MFDRIPSKTKIVAFHIHDRVMSYTTLKDASRLDPLWKTFWTWFKRPTPFVCQYFGRLSVLTTWPHNQRYRKKNPTSDICLHSALLWTIEKASHIYLRIMLSNATLNLILKKGGTTYFSSK